MQLNYNFLMELDRKTEIRYRTIPNGKYNRELQEYESYITYPKYICDRDGRIVCYESEINNFLELLSAFVSNQLTIDRPFPYKLSYRNGDAGFSGRIVKKDGIRYLKVTLKDKTYYLEKYDCRVIVANAKRILSKCSIKGIQLNNLRH